MRILGSKEIGKEWMEGRYEGKQVRIISVVDRADEDTSVALVRILSENAEEFRVPLKFVHPLDRSDIHPRDYCVILSGPNRGKRGPLNDDQASIEHEELGVVPMHGSAFTLCERA